MDTAPRALLATSVLVITLGLCGCGSGGGDCRPPTVRERVYPFTGKWEGQSEPSQLCLYQQDAQRVLGSWDGRALAGLVRPDGRLDIAASDGRAPQLITLTKHGDTLRVERGLLASGQEAASGPFLRH